MMLATISTAAPSIVMRMKAGTNSRAAATPDGGRHAQSPSPTSGITIPAASIISIARGKARASIHPAVRAYQ